MNEITMPVETPRATTGSPSTALALLRGFAYGGLIATMIAMALLWWDQGLFFNPLVDLLFGAALGFLCLSLFDGILGLLRNLAAFVARRAGKVDAAARLKAIKTPPFGFTIGIIILITIDWFLPEDLGKYFAVPPLLEIFILISAISGALFVAYRLSTSPVWKRALPLAAIVVLFALYLVWGFSKGSDAYAAPVERAAATEPLPLDNPGLPGPLAVQTLSYGSGTDKHRQEYGEGAALLTQPVDGSPVFAGYSGIPGAQFKWYWGFDFTQLPLNGLVWYPEGEGPFPIVLIVHGNHGMGEPSDPGYAYLGEHLASRGYIAVSVDENFLNGWMLGDGNMEEMPLRAWLLLEHLKVWREWNETPGNPFYGKVDLERVGLIGHSRGGEAVAHAAEMNAYDHKPISTIAKASEFGFGIQGVVAIAPCDDRFQPDGKSLKLKNADYLLVATGHDADMYWLDGQGQYNRATLADKPDGFKALTYLYRGNHGQFNTVWGDDDRGDINSWLLNRRAYLSGEEQRQAAKTLITAFLDASLGDQDGYRQVFRDPVSAAAWLPDDILVTQYQDTTFIPVDMNEGGGKETVDVAGGTVSAEGVKSWRTIGLFARNGETLLDNHVIELTWEPGSEPVYALDLPAGTTAGWGLSPDHALALSFTTAEAAGTPGPVTVELEDGHGTRASLPLEAAAPLHPALPVVFTKADWIATQTGYDLDTKRPEEYVLQTYALPLRDFQAAAPAFNPADIRAIRVRFDGSEGGSVLLDNIGFWAMNDAN